MALQTLIDLALRQGPANPNGYPVKIRNQSSNIAEYYQLNAPYALLFETISQTSPSSILISTPNLTSSSFIELHRMSSEEDQMSLLNRPLHKHDFLEIMYVIRGELKQKIEDKCFLYSAGQCCMLNSRIRHAEDFSTDFTAVFIMLSHAFLREHFNHTLHLTDDAENSLKQSSIYRMVSHKENHGDTTKKEYIDFVPIAPILNFKSKVDDILEDMLSETMDPKPGSISIFEGLLERFLSYFDNETLYKRTFKTENSKNREDIFINITHYIEASNGKVSRKELEHKLNYSADYLNKIVKLNTGMSLVEYGQIFLLKEAESLLLYSDLSIGEIIQTLGFSNRSYFYRLFQSKHKMTPVDFRKIHRAE